jgi:NADH dehydrogenase
MIVVVGGTGFIGGHLVERLRAAGHDVVVTSHDRGRAAQPGRRFADLCVPASLEAALEGAEVVVQSTCFPGYPIEKPRQGLTFEAYDAMGTRHLVEAAQRRAVRRYVFVAGVGVCEGARGRYFRAIHAGEEAVRRGPFEHAILRPAFVYGPRDRGLNRILAVARYTPVLPVVGLAARHQPVYVGDVVEALELLARPGGPSGTFEIGGPERLTMSEMLSRAFAAAQVRCRLLEVPRPLGRLAGRLLQRLPGELLSPDAIDFISEDFVADDRAFASLLPAPRTWFADGLLRTLASRT